MKKGLYPVHVSMLRCMILPSEEEWENYLTKLSYLSQPALHRLLLPLASVENLKILWVGNSDDLEANEILQQALKSVRNDERDNRDLLLEATALLLANPVNARNFLNAHSKQVYDLFVRLCSGEALTMDSKMIPKLRNWIITEHGETLLYGPLALLMHSNNSYILPRSLHDFLKKVSGRTSSALPRNEGQQSESEDKLSPEENSPVKDISPELHHYSVSPESLNYAFSFLSAMRRFDYFKSRTTISQKNIKLIKAGVNLPINPLDELIPDFLSVNVDFVCASYVWLSFDDPSCLLPDDNESLLKHIYSPSGSILKSLILEVILNNQVKFKSEYMSTRVARAFLKDFFKDENLKIKDLADLKKEYYKIWYRLNGQKMSNSDDMDRLLTVLLFILAGFGLYELEWYDDKENKAPDSLHIFNATMTPLGEYVLSKNPEFSMPEAVVFPGPRLDPERLFFYVEDQVSPYLFFYESLGRALSPIRYAVTFDSFFKATKDFEEKQWRMAAFLKLMGIRITDIAKLPSIIAKNLPPVWQELFNTVYERKDAVTTLNEYYVCLKLNPHVKGLIEFVMQDEFFIEKGFRGQDYTYFFSRRYFPQAVAILKSEGYDIDDRIYFY